MDTRGFSVVREVQGDDGEEVEAKNERIEMNRDMQAEFQAASAERLHSGAVSAAPPKQQSMRNWFGWLTWLEKSLFAYPILHIPSHIPLSK